MVAPATLADSTHPLMFHRVCAMCSQGEQHLGESGETSRNPFRVLRNKWESVEDVENRKGIWEDHLDPTAAAEEESGR